ncbi:hypothetical protein [uncultured Sphingomonas sp.]|jgi:hypothetical protein|uniref:hypothetical protein n=1 Tax=uncultured Sphingomonas sp. TaxID=158754 RepID=UPI0025F547FE|nr:hypothetical protein [uncultured Sphingomonas sp.]
MNREELARLPVGTKIEWVIGEGENERCHPAKFLEKTSNYRSILVYFNDKLQQKIRWSISTNQPIGQSTGYVGKVRLEMRR